MMNDESKPKGMHRFLKTVASVSIVFVALIVTCELPLLLRSSLPLYDINLHTTANRPFEQDVRVIQLYVDCQSPDDYIPTRTLTSRVTVNEEPLSVQYWPARTIYGENAKMGSCVGEGAFLIVPEKFLHDGEYPVVVTTSQYRSRIFGRAISVPQSVKTYSMTVKDGEIVDVSPK